MKSIAIKSEITGTVCKVEANAGQTLGADDTILLIESMKMEIPVQAPQAGLLTKVFVNEGDSITEGDTLATLESA